MSDPGDLSKNNDLPDGAAGPDWSLLPYRAREFFGLETEFDRKQLKRAYSKLIRKFKPEKFPNEFQRIRAAFEQLENELRYGKSPLSTAMPIEEYVWQTEADPKPAATPDDPKPPKRAPDDSASRKRAPDPVIQPASPTVRERLQSEQPAKVYKEIAAKQTKSPYEYFALATLADVVTQDETMYFKWLLTGLKEHKDDPGLFQLLQQFFRRDHKTEMLQSLLVTASKVVSHDGFYFLTEKSWCKLLNQINFAKFKQLLARCEMNLNDHRNRWQVVFYSELLRAAIWIADPGWLNEKFKILEGDFQNANQDFELLDLLKEYHVQRSELVGDCSVRRQIDGAIKDYFMLEEREGDQAIVACQNQMASNAQALLDAFPDDPLGQWQRSPMTFLWMMINEDVAQRNGINFGFSSRSRKEKQRFVKRVDMLVDDLDESWHLGMRHVLPYFLMILGSYLLLSIAPVTLLWNWLGRTEVLVLCIVLMIGLVVLNKLYLHPKTLLPLFQRYCQKAVKGAYEKLWRGRFVQLFDATGATMNDLLPVMDQIMNDDETLKPSTTWLVPLVALDQGLAYYSMAAPYCR